VIFLHPRDEQGNTPLFTAEWNDDFHNAAHVFATGETHAYYQDFAFEPEKKFARALAEGFVYQGEVSLQTGESRGVECTRSRRSSSSILFRTTIRPGIAPRASGLSPSRVPIKRGCCLPRCCFPHIPLLFMGEEFGETHPFLFFTDFHGDLAKAVREGRAKEFTGHAGHDETVPDPNDVNTFIRSKLDWNKIATDEGKTWLRFTRHLLTLRHRYIVPLLHHGGAVEGKVIKTAPGMVAVSWRFPSGTLSLALNIGNKPVACPRSRGDALCLAGGNDVLPRTVLSFALLMEKHRYDPFRHVPYSVP
jgi:1,4-alpha-glucan branching enzyme